MRAVLVIIGWILLFGAAANAAMTLVALYAVATGGFSDWRMPVGAVIEDYAPFLSWTKAAAAAILPAKVADFFFAAPALVVFPVRAVVAYLLGSWALRVGRRRSA